MREGRTVEIMDIQHSDDINSHAAACCTSIASSCRVGSSIRQTSMKWETSHPAPVHLPLAA